jgi:PAS domain S-box-containing protein/putative nucleotidyltransferase with HDIG domain
MEELAAARGRLRELEILATAAKRAGEGPEGSEEKFRNVVESSPMGIHMYELAPDGRLIFIGANPAADEILGVDNSQFIGKTLEEAFPPLAGTEVPERYRLAAAQGELWHTEQIVYEDERIKGAFDVTAFQTSPGKMAAMFLGVTERKRAEEALRESEERFRNVVESSPMGVHMYELAPDGRLIFIGANRAADEILAVDNSQFIGKTLEEAFPPLAGTEVPERYRLAAAQGELWHTEQIVYEDEQIKGAFGVTAFQTSPGRMAAMFLDVTERKRAEEALRESEEKYSNLFHHSRDAVIIHDLEGAVLDSNEQASDLFGYTREEFASLSVEDLHPPEALAASREAFGRISREGFIRFEIDFQKKDGSVFPAEVSSSLFEIAGKKVIQGIPRDITERKRAYERLQQSLYGTIKAISKIVEERDPYTSGHQSRVAALARAIAGEMGLSEDRVEGIFVAASAHDIGKISIPAEILSKPGQLTEMELNIIKAHTEVGHEILKNVEFPWPVTEVVLQHHEHLDGSGYPAGLGGDDILLEARILCVADVVEAMSSHRPYRPHLGEGKGFEEITQYRGVRYDADAVDACLRLFREKGFLFE